MDSIPGKVIHNSGEDERGWVLFVESAARYEVFLLIDRQLTVCLPTTSHLVMNTHMLCYVNLDKKILPYDPSIC